MLVYNCLDFSGVFNGYYVIDKIYYENGDQVYFICYFLYLLEGNFILMCDGNIGNWLGMYFMCFVIIIIIDVLEYEGKKNRKFIFID